MAKSFDERELSPIFTDPATVMEAVLGRKPEPELEARILSRRGRRSRTEQPSEALRAEKALNPF